MSYPTISPGLVDGTPVPSYADLTFAHTTPEVKALRNTYVVEAGVLKKRLADGTLEDVKNITEINGLTANTATDGKVLLVGIKDTATITSYFTDCINGTGIDGCSKFLADPNFHELSYQAIDDMEPLAVVKLLKAYKFDVVTHYDPRTKSNMDSMQSVGQWHTSVVNKITDKAVRDSILSNHKLSQFLGALVDKLDQNPHILNPTYKGEASLRRPQMSGRISQYIPSMPSQRGLDPNIPTHADIQRIIMELQRISAVLPRFQTGGGNNVQHGGLLTFNARDLQHRSSNVFRGMYGALSSALAKMNKGISQPDHGRILELIDQIEEKEEKLNYAVQTIEKYINTLRNGNTDENSFNNVKAMQDFVALKNKAVKSISSRQEVLAGIFGGLNGVIYGVIPRR